MEKKMIWNTNNVFQDCYIVASYFTSNEKLKSLSCYHNPRAVCILLQNKGVTKQEISDALGTYLQGS